METDRSNTDKGRNMKEDLKKMCLKDFRTISRILDSIDYDLEAREYTLSEYEMAKVFTARDMAQMALHNLYTEGMKE